MINTDPNLAQSISAATALEVKAAGIPYVFGGFVAALKSDPVWVMNVVLAQKPPTLDVIFDRGLIGVYHDWYEMKLLIQICIAKKLFFIQCFSSFSIVPIKNIYK